CSCRSISRRCCASWRTRTSTPLSPTPAATRKKPRSCWAWGARRWSRSCAVAIPTRHAPDRTRATRLTPARDAASPFPSSRARRAGAARRIDGARERHGRCNGDERGSRTLVSHALTLLLALAAADDKGPIGVNATTAVSAERIALEPLRGPIDIVADPYAGRI